jgi:SAM-dependent methyltransferase
MAKPELIARQSRLPTGLLGEIVARVMSLETRPANAAAVRALAPAGDDAILEVGCGHGRTLAGIAAGPCGHLSGIDPSEVMVRLARRRLRRWIDAGRADVSLASSAKIPHADGRFDAALAVHVIYFWSDPLADLGELRRVLRPGGRLLLGYRPLCDETRDSLPSSVYALRAVDEVEQLLARSGFTSVQSTEASIGKTSLVLTRALAS